MKKFILPLLAASMAATPALAAPTITFSSTNTGIPGYTTAQYFETFESQAGGGAAFANTVNPVPGTSATVQETGNNALVFSASVPGIAADPDSNPSNKYLAVQGGGTFTLTFSAPVQFFSFIIGSIDSYNNLKLVLSDGTTVGGSSGLFGDQIIGGATPGPFNSSVAGRVNYDFNGGAGLVSAIFTSTNDAFEIDDLAAAVPEAATWAMMMVGLGVVGGAMRRRKVSVSYAAA